MTWRSGETNVGPSLTAWISAHPHIIQFIFASLTLCPSYLVNNLPHRPQLPALDPERTLSYRLLNHSYNYKSQTIVANHPKYVSSIGSAFLSKLGHRRKGSHHMHKVLTHTDLALSELLWYLQPEKKSREDSEQRHFDSWIHSWIYHRGSGRGKRFTKAWDWFPPLWLKRKEGSRLHPTHTDYHQGKKNWILGRRRKEWWAGRSTCPQYPSCLLVLGGVVFTWRRRNKIQLTEKQWLLCPALSLVLPIYHLLFIPTLTLWGNRSSGRYNNPPKSPIWGVQGLELELRSVCLCS